MQYVSRVARYIQITDGYGLPRWPGYLYGESKLACQINIESDWSALDILAVMINFDSVFFAKDHAIGSIYLLPILGIAGEREAE